MGRIYNKDGMKMDDVEIIRLLQEEITNQRLDSKIHEPCKISARNVPGELEDKEFNRGDLMHILVDFTHDLPTSYATSAEPGTIEYIHKLCKHLVTKWMRGASADGEDEESDTFIRFFLAYNAPAPLMSSKS